MVESKENDKVILLFIPLLTQLLIRIYKRNGSDTRLEIPTNSSSSHMNNW